MREISVRDAKLELELMLLEQGLNPEALILREAWRVYTAFLRRKVHCHYDSGSVQGRHGVGVDGKPRFYLSLIRQFADDEEGRRVPIRHIVAEFAFDSSGFPAPAPWMLWTDEFDTLGEFIASVQKRPEFEKALHAPVISSEVYQTEC